MASIQRVSCKNMEKDAEALSTALKDIPQTITQMQASLKNLASCWEGPAWAAFQEQVNKDIENINEVYQCLTELQKGLGTGRETYLRTEFDVYTDVKALLI
ncbi:MAG: WXG100 family type VII secretion target [Lachnospiraceae bacterium]|nr:WXG100 family type VII secretion target [Lachnospiraceae bacterium]